MATIGTKLDREPSVAGMLHPGRTTGRTAQRSLFHIRRSLFLAADFLGIWGGALLALAITTHRQHPRTLVEMGVQVSPVALGSVLIVLFCHAQQLYSSLQLSARKEFIAIVKGVFMAALLLCGFLFACGIKTTSRNTVGVTAISALIWMFGWRYLRRLSIANAVADGLTFHNVLIVGTDSLADAVQEHLTQQRHLGFVVLGLLSTPGSLSRSRRPPNPDNVLGTVEELASLCRRNFVDEVIICGQDRETVNFVVKEAQGCGVGVRVIPDLYDGMAWRAQLDYLGDFPSLALVHRHIPAIELVLKRLLDITLSAIALIVLAPVLILLALVIKLDSPGPILYISQRVGRKGRIFSCRKFRTMVTNAEQLKDGLNHLNQRDGILFKIKDDPRITRSGRFMRKYSLDELAQFWNVLRGDMSLVGPRPPLASEVQQYELEYLRRLEVAPGITGLWQVEARAHPSFERYIALDLRYIENWSLALDLKILLRTVAVVFSGTGS